MCYKPLYFNRKSGGLNIITNRTRALTARRADRRVDARLTTKSISQHPADIRNESSVPELSLDHAARALCYTWRSGPFFGLDNSRVTGRHDNTKQLPVPLTCPLYSRVLGIDNAPRI